MGNWVAVEDGLPNHGEDVAVWLECADDEPERNSMVFAKLTKPGPTPIWKDRRGGEYGCPSSAWKVTHWARVDLAR